MEIYKGTSAFSGIAIGKILYYHRGEYQIRQSMVDNVKKELDRLDNARTAVKNQIQHMYKNGAPLPKEQELTLKRQLKLLSGGSFQRAVESMITTEKVSAAYAVQTTRDELANVFRKLEDEAVKEQIENIREISELLIGAMGGSHARINLGDEPVILAAEQLSPNELLEMNKASLLAVVMHQGSVISHVSIMAKSMEVPTLVEVEIQKEWDGHMAIVDGYTGTLYIDPEPELLKEYEIRHAADKEEREELLRLRNQKDITADGKEIKLLANIGNLDDLNTVLYYGAAGIGLLRSEFQYLGRENYPRENELFRAYKKVAEDMDERPAVIRTVDLGADGSIFSGGNAIEAAMSLEAAGADAVGINCSVGPDQLVSVIRNIKENVSIPVIAKPNAGMPQIDDLGNAVYSMTPADFAGYMKVLVDNGASVIGGCCGTTPEFISETAQVLGLR